MTDYNTGTLSDTQHELANAMLKEMNYRLEQLFWGSEYNLEWTDDDRIAEARKILTAVADVLPLIINKR